MCKSKAQFPSFRNLTSVLFCKSRKTRSIVALIPDEKKFSELTHWGRVTHICVSKLTIIDSDNGLSPGRRQAIIWTNAGIWLIRTLGTNFSKILGEIHSFSFSKMYLKMSSAKWRLFGLGLIELTRDHKSRTLFLTTMTSQTQMVPTVNHLNDNHSKQVTHLIDDGSVSSENVYRKRVPPY